MLKHKGVQHVDHVDLDGDVTEVCKKHFPWGNAWSDSRSKLCIEDGAAFVAKAEDASYDVIIQDSSDPWIAGEDGEMMPLPSGVLYEEEHICELYRILKPNGILNIQVRDFFKTPVICDDNRRGNIKQPSQSIVDMLYFSNSRIFFFQFVG